MIKFALTQLAAQFYSPALTQLAAHFYRSRQAKVRCSNEYRCRTRATSREEKNLQSFLEQPKEKWLESSLEVDGPHYFTLMAVHILPPERWRATRIDFLRRLLVTTHVRKVSPGGASK